MEEKTSALRREILKGLIERYGNKGKKVLIQKAKDKGVYKNYVTDEEVFELITKFADFHNLPITEPVEVYPEAEPCEEPIKEVYHEREEDVFYTMLKEQRDSLSKKLITVNKLIDLYKENP